MIHPKSAENCCPRQFLYCCLSFSPVLSASWLCKRLCFISFDGFVVVRQTVFFVHHRLTTITSTHFLRLRRFVAIVIQSTREQKQPSLKGRGFPAGVWGSLIQLQHNYKVKWFLMVKQVQRQRGLTLEMRSHNCKIIKNSWPSVPVSVTWTQIWLRSGSAASFIYRGVSSLLTRLHGTQWADMEENRAAKKEKNHIFSATAVPH